MATKMIKLVDASNAQLLAHAVKLGIDARQGHSNHFLVGKIQLVAPGTDEIEVEDTTPPADIVKPAAPVAGAPEDPRFDPQVEDRMVGVTYREDPKVTIEVPSTSEKGGDRDVQVGVNGVTFTIRRNTPMEVPYRVFEALNNSEEITYEQTRNPNDPLTPITVERRSKGYPFSVIEMPPKAEVDAWRARTAEHFAP